MKTVRDRILEMLPEATDRAKVTDESKLLEDLNLDSIDIIEVVMGVEDEFDLSIDDNEVEKWKTFGDVVKYVSTKVP